MLDDVDRQRSEPDQRIRHLQVRGLNHIEYAQARQALYDAGLGDVMIVEPECFPSSGIWHVRRQRGSRMSTLVSRKLSDLPKALKMAALWPFKEVITRAIVEFWNQNKQKPYSAADLAEFITGEFAKAVQKEAEHEFVQSLKGIQSDDE